MTKLLNLDEMQEALQTVDPVFADRARAMMEAIGTMMADRLGEKLDVVPGLATCEGTAFSGTCASFRPKRPGQPCPEPLTHYDSDEWDDEGDEEIEAMAKAAGQGAAIARGMIEERAEFQAYLRNCTDDQVQGVCDKERAAGRDWYLCMALDEVKRRAEA